MRLLRIAVCQLECHPALYVGHIAFIEEPFVPAASGPSLSQLSTKGLDVSSLQQKCHDEYLAWQNTRIRAILDFLTTLSPVPDIVFFPECSIPPNCLTIIADWSSRTGATVLAGTHTLQRRATTSQQYVDLGIDRKDLKRLYKLGSPSVLPLIVGAKCTLLPKLVASPFEATIIDKSTTSIPVYQPRRVHSHDGPVELLPLICVEALRQHNVKKSYDVVGVLSFDAKPGQFQPFITQQVANKKVVVYCNDGAAGGSFVYSARDSRTQDWLRDVMPDGLPKGDSILVAEVDLDVGATEVGTADPARSLRLLNLSSIVCERTPEAQVSSELLGISRMTEAPARAQELRKLLRERRGTVLQQARMKFLCDSDSRGLETEEWWAVLGQDCLVLGAESLQQLEGRLASTCAAHLTSLLPSTAVQDASVASTFLTFLAQCQKRAKGLRAQDIQSIRDIGLAIADRDGEIHAIHEFLDDPQLSVLEVTGLQGIGKSSVIHKALIQSGVDSILRIPVTSTSSPDYIVYSILQYGSGFPEPPYKDPVEMLMSGSIQNVMGTLRVLIIERADLLIDHESFRDELFPKLLTVLVEVASKSRTKLILETRREVPFDLDPPGLRKRMRIAGLERDLVQFGISIFDSQLRRVGLSPAVLSDRDKETVITRLGGHPVAIALAADVAYDEGIIGLLAALKQPRGFFFSYVRRIVEALGLADEDRTIMQLCCLARGAVPREAVLGAVAFPAAPAIRNLVSLSALEIDSEGCLKVPGIIKEYFDPQELMPEQVKAFHSGAARAFAQISKTNPGALAAAVEAEFHARVAGINVGISLALIDGALASAEGLFRDQRYEEAAKILEPLLLRNSSLSVMRLAAQVHARRNRFDLALPYARQVFNRNPRDTWLLSELAKTALTLFQDDEAADQLIAIARDAAVEDVSILIVEGRMYLRRQQLDRAEAAFKKAKQLSEHNPWPYYYLGQVYLRSGRIEEAINTLHDGEEFYYKVGPRRRNALNAIKTQLGLAYLYDDRMDLASPIIESLMEEDATSPEVIRAYAILAIKRDGIQEAHKALERLNEAKIRNRADRCQFHLLYGLFYLGIDDPGHASQEFARAHAADEANVFVMMKWARTLFELGLARWMDGDESYKAYLNDCARLVRKMLEFDRDNAEGVKLMHSLAARFKIEI